MINLLPLFAGNVRADTSQLNTLVNQVNNVITAVNAGGSGSGTVTSVNASGGTTGLTFTGGPVTGSGTLTLAGALIPANGGTGLAGITNGQILIGNNLGGFNSRILAAGSNVTITDNGTNITVAASGSGGTLTATAQTNSFGLTLPANSLIDHVIIANTTGNNPIEGITMGIMAPGYLASIMPHPFVKDLVTVLSDGQVSVISTNVAGTYINGASGVGATITTSSGSLNRDDGAPVSNGENIAVVGQTTPSHNGVYTASGVGTTIVLTRTPGFDSSSDFTNGMMLSLRNYSDTMSTVIFVAQYTPSNPVIGTDAISFTPIVPSFSGNASTPPVGTANTMALGLLGQQISPADGSLDINATLSKYDANIPDASSVQLFPFDPSQTVQLVFFADLSAGGSGDASFNSASINATVVYK